MPTAYVKAKLDLNLTQSNPSRLGSVPLWQTLPSFVLEALAGTGIGMVDEIYGDERTIAASTNDSIDLNGSINNVIGTGSLSILTLCGIFIYNKPVDLTLNNTTNLTMGGAPNNFANLLGNVTATLVLKPGEVFFRMNSGSGGLATLTPGTGDIINIANGAGAQNKYQFAAWGRSVTP